jgi:transcriptional regulator with XRE-family HTH domain
MKQNRLDAKKIGSNIKRAIRASAYRTQEEFAAKFGTGVRNLSRWCNGGIEKFYIVQEIADFLGIDVLTLLF